MPPLLLKLVFGAIPDRTPGLIRPLVRMITGQVETSFVDPQLQTHFDYWEGVLASIQWFAGEAFSAADVMMSFPVEAAAQRGDALTGRPHLKAFLDAIHSRPAWRTALEKGGPYSFA